MSSKTSARSGFAEEKNFPAPFGVIPDHFLHRRNPYHVQKSCAEAMLPADIYKVFRFLVEGRYEAAALITLALTEAPGTSFFAIAILNCQLRQPSTLVHQGKYAKFWHVLDFSGLWKKLPQMAPNRAGGIFFLLIQTLPTFWAEQI